MNRSSALVLLLTVLAAAPAGAAEPTVHTPPAFPTNIRQIHATETGAYLQTGNNQIWFVEPTGAARQVPIPLDGRIEHTDYEPAGGLLWGCTRTAVFATNAAGAWQSWGLGEDPARRGCFVAPSPGSTWVVANTADQNTVYADMAPVGGGDLTVELERRQGAQFQPVATDEAGGLWAVPMYPHTGIAHFDGASWRVWSPNRQTFVGTDYVDIFPFDRAVHPQVLAADGTGGVISATPFEFTFMRSNAPYPHVERITPQQPGFGLPSHALAVGPDRIWGGGMSGETMVLASWDFSGRLVGAEPVPTPKWYDHKAAGGSPVVAADAHGVWLATNGVLFHRHPDRWSVFAAQSTIDHVRRTRRRQQNAFWGALPLVVAGTMAAVIAPALWAERLGVSYGRGALETIAGTALTVPTHFAVIDTGVWEGSYRTPMLLTFGAIFTTGIATVATVTPEAVIAEKGDPFPIGGAVLGGAIGWGTGAMVDLVLELAGVESKVGRAVLWSSFAGIGAPLGFHLMRASNN